MADGNLGGLSQSPKSTVSFDLGYSLIRDNLGYLFVMYPNGTLQPAMKVKATLPEKLPTPTSPSATVAPFWHPTRKLCCGTPAQCEIHHSIREAVRSSPIGQLLRYGEYDSVYSARNSLFSLRTPLDLRS